MPLVDVQGRSWAHSSTVKTGDVLITDGGFTCMGKHARRTVKIDDTSGDLYVDCDDGKHFLYGQTGDDGELVGLYNLNSFDGEHAPNEPEPDPPREEAA